MEATVSLNLLDAKEAAERCDYSPRTLRWQANRGKIQAQKVGNQWVFPEQEIDRLSNEAAT
ncbi:helix-turn-helix domain-containing protein [Salinibacter ruber]|uniref:helix-turn-helix domain-containing protein n=1 Tax=Salinibacter ruber TaxID=146919 RepID=UPI002450614B|nr:putative site-specific integrase-resolvase [Salinibacter ruber]